MHLRHIKVLILISTLLDNYVTPEQVYKLLNLLTLESHDAKINRKINMKFIAYIWKPGMKTAMLSKENETFDEFKARVYSCYPYQMEYMAQFSEFKEIY